MLSCIGTMLKIFNICIFYKALLAILLANSVINNGDATSQQ
ncbi:hypothetical protein Q604_UNBC16285G0001, partial [human gut metagenome]